MTISGEDLSGLQCLPDEVSELLLGVVLTNLVVDLLEPDENLQRNWF